MGLKELDTTDISILNLIQKDARLTHKEIAYKTSKSLSATQVRIRKLQDIGIIKKFVTLLDRKRVGRGMAVFTLVKLNSSALDAITGFQSSTSVFQEVMECYQVSGENDFILKILVSDIDAYNEFMVKKLSVLPQIGGVKSMFVIAESKCETAFQL
jgi:Lrp/AsnC family leucine-responsive transcriptional regulator